MKNTFVQTISTLPSGFIGENNLAEMEIQIDAAGRFLYASNRGHDSTAVFAIDPSRGTDRADTRKDTAQLRDRSHRKYLLAANQDSDQLVEDAGRVHTKCP